MLDRVFTHHGVTLMIIVVTYYAVPFCQPSFCIRFTIFGLAVFLPHPGRFKPRQTSVEVKMLFCVLSVFVVVFCLVSCEIAHLGTGISPCDGPCIVCRLA